VLLILPLSKTKTQASQICTDEHVGKLGRPPQLASQKEKVADQEVQARTKLPCTAQKEFRDH